MCPEQVNQQRQERGRWLSRPGKKSWATAGWAWVKMICKLMEGWWHNMLKVLNTTELYNYAELLHAMSNSKQKEQPKFQMATVGPLEKIAGQCKCPFHYPTPTPVRTIAWPIRSRWTRRPLSLSEGLLCTPRVAGVWQNPKDSLAQCILLSIYTPKGILRDI